MEHHHADLGDVRLHYIMSGHGFPVVLLHGWPQSWYEWRHIMPRLAAECRVIAPDLRGLGRREEIVESLRGMATGVRGGGVIDCDHWMPEEQPEELLRQLLTFFKAS